MDRSREEGTKAESRFILRANDMGWEYIRNAKKFEDMWQHWDILFDTPEGEKTIDIKAHKHKYRSGPLLEDWFWVEFRNVKGDKGWLYGEADYIAFEYFGAWYIYDREILANCCELLVDMDADPVDKTGHAYYRLYQRYGRKDQTSLVQISDLPYKYHWSTLF